MVDINIKADIRGVQRMLTDTAKKALPQAERAAVNALAFDVMRAERAGAKSLFANPRPFTVNGFLVDQAKPEAEPSALVYARPEVEKYLDPYEFGGNHVLPGQAALIPVDAAVDQYGQLAKGYMQRLVGRADIYVGTIKGVTGVWQRMNVTRTGDIRIKGRSRGQQYHESLGAIRLLIRFGNAVPVNKRLNFEIRARAIVAANFMLRFRDAIAKFTK
jgi:hypothetical protein